MFPARKQPNAVAARKELRNHLVILGVWCAAIRVAPYVLDALQEKRN